MTTSPAPKSIQSQNGILRVQLAIVIAQLSRFGPHCWRNLVPKLATTATNRLIFTWASPATRPLARFYLAGVRVAGQTIAGQVSLRSSTWIAKRHWPRWSWQRRLLLRCFHPAHECPKQRHAQDDCVNSSHTIVSPRNNDPLFAHRVRKLPNPARSPTIPGYPWNSCRATQIGRHSWELSSPRSRCL